MRFILFLVLQIASFAAQGNIHQATTLALVSGCDKAFVEGEFNCRFGRAVASQAGFLNPGLGQYFASLNNSSGWIDNRHAEEIKTHLDSLQAGYQKDRAALAQVYGKKVDLALPFLKLAVQAFTAGEFYYKRGNELKQALIQIHPDLASTMTDMIDTSGRVSDRYRHAVVGLYSVFQDLSLAAGTQEPPATQKKVLTLSEARYLLNLLKQNEWDEAKDYLQEAIDKVSGLSKR